LVKSDLTLAQRLKNIKTAKGFGDITILTVLAETRCFQLVTNQKQLDSYAGFEIVFNDSGLKKGKTSISKKGNIFIRIALFMPALSACRANPQFKNFYQRLVVKVKIKNLLSLLLPVNYSCSSIPSGNQIHFTTLIIKRSNTSKIYAVSCSLKYYLLYLLTFTTVPG
jgi:Transposase IS116/IS110/IS902 family